MSDIIQLLPESIANQIHAGEVVQRPSSVVKELIENAIDAGASQIQVNIKGAGRTLIQVIDNGTGMSETDARMAFELHATSKISTSEDLFNIRTMGFRGEALAAISIVADVELRTKRKEDELGTFIHIVGSKVETQECTQCPSGTNFQIKNLFFNSPGRRKFLKKDATELKHIINEFQRIALANPAVGMSLIHNGDTLFDLSASDSLRMRILALFGKANNQKLLPVETNTSIVNISGFVGHPKYARKTYGEQFFFVNKRYMKHPYFHKAITLAFDRLLPPDTYPSYFLFFDIEPNRIDVNVSPNKTEVKFENEKDIWQIIKAAVKEVLGKYNVMPSIDFDQEGSIDIPIALKADENIAMPSIEIDTSYNPFNTNSNTNYNPNNYSSGGVSNSNGGYQASKKQDQVKHWESLYQSFEQSKEEDDTPIRETATNTSLEIAYPDSTLERKHFQLKGKYIVSPVRSGIMVINQRRAHQRILFEAYNKMLAESEVASQKLLFPQQLELSPTDSAILSTVNDELSSVGFIIEEKENDVFEISGIPAILKLNSPAEVLEQMLQRLKEGDHDLRHQTKEKIAEILSEASAIPYGHILQAEELNLLVDQLFACSMPNYTPKGKSVLSIIQLEQLDKLLS